MPYPLRLQGTDRSPTKSEWPSCTLGDCSPMSLGSTRTRTGRTNQPIYGSQVLANARLADPTQLQQVQGLRYVYKALSGQGHFGRWIEAERGPPTGGPITRAQRRAADQAQAHPLPIHLSLPSSRLRTLSDLAPVALLRSWNDLAWEDSAVDVGQALSSLDAFTRALPLLLKRRPAPLPTPSIGHTPTPPPPAPDL